MARMQNQTKKGKTEMSFDVGSLILETYHYENKDIPPLYILFYVMDVTSDSDGKQTVRLTPPHYQYTGREPQHDFTLDEIKECCTVIRSKEYDFFSDAIRDADGKKIGMRYTTAPAHGSKVYEVLFKKHETNEETTTETTDERTNEYEEED